MPCRSFIGEWYPYAMIKTSHRPSGRARQLTGRAVTKSMQVPRSSLLYD